MHADDFSQSLDLKLKKLLIYEPMKQLFKTSPFQKILISTSAEPYRFIECIEIE